MYSIYLTRHGRCESPDNVSKKGIVELGIIKEQLDKLKFNATTALFSKANRCKETSLFLAPHAIQYELKCLAGGTNATLTKRMNEVVSTILQFKNQDILVVTHDNAPLIYGLRLAELFGAHINWENALEESFRNNIDQGEGILVCGTSYKKLMYKNPH